MKSYIGNHKIHGKTLYLEYGDIRLGIPIEFGLRISELYYKGSENLFFEQPLEMTALTTPDGWRVRGGHRLWVAPEGDFCYHPDNEPISYTLYENGVSLMQNKDPRLNMVKAIHISFTGVNCLEIKHEITNLNDTSRKVALWGITSVDGGGVEEIYLNQKKKNSLPTNVIAAWSYTSLGDERAEFDLGKITLRHKPTSKLFKIGVGHPRQAVSYTNKGVILKKDYEVFENGEYTDGGVSYETYMCDYMVELETLSPLYEISPGERRAHTEIWTLESN